MHPRRLKHRLSAVHTVAEEGFAVVGSSMVGWPSKVVFQSCTAVTVYCLQYNGTVRLGLELVDVDVDLRSAAAAAVVVFGTSGFAFASVAGGAGCIDYSLDDNVCTGGDFVTVFPAAAAAVVLIRG